MNLNSALWMVVSLLFGVWVAVDFSRWWVRAVLLLSISVVGYFVGGILGPVSLPQLLGLVGGIMALACWNFWCNYRVYRDKLAMVTFLSNNHPLPNWWQLSEATDTLSYGDHLWQYVTFQNPMRHYPPILQLAVKRAPPMRELQRIVREAQRRHREREPLE